MRRFSAPIDSGTSRSLFLLVLLACFAWEGCQLSSQTSGQRPNPGTPMPCDPFPRPVTQKLRQIRPRPFSTMNILTGARERAHQGPQLGLLEGVGSAHPKSKLLSPARQGAHVARPASMREAAQFESGIVFLGRRVPCPTSGLKY